MRWKFAKGDVHRVKIHQEVDATTVVLGTEVKVSQQSDLWLVLKVIDVNPLGEAKIVSTLKRASGNMTTTAGTVTFDTKMDPPSGAIEKAIDEKYRVLVGVDVEMTMAPTGKVTKTVLPESLPKQCANGTCRPAQQIEAFQNIWALELGATADTPGGQWMIETALETPAGRAVVEKTYTNKGYEANSAGRCVKFGTVTKMKNDRPAEVTEPKITFESQASVGSVLFNHDAGHTQAGEWSEAYEVNVDADAAVPGERLFGSLRPLACIGAASIVLCCQRFLPSQMKFPGSSCSMVNNLTDNHLAEDAPVPSHL